jgi:hypothetical protein
MTMIRHSYDTNYLDTSYPLNREFHFLYQSVNLIALIIGVFKINNTIINLKFQIFKKFQMTQIEHKL